MSYPTANSNMYIKIKSVHHIPNVPIDKPTTKKPQHALWSCNKNQNKQLLIYTSRAKKHFIIIMTLIIITRFANFYIFQEANYCNNQEKQ